MNKISKEHERVIRLKVAESLGKAEAFFGREFDMPEITFDVRGENNAGKANSTEWKVAFNVRLLAEDYNHVVHHTAPHECAHLVADTVYGSRQHHNSNWAFVMEQVMGIEAKQYHSIATEGWQAKRPYRYACRCRYHYLTVKMHRTAQHGSRKCTSCKAVLVHRPFELMDEPTDKSEYWLLGNNGRNVFVPSDLWIWLLADSKIGQAIGCSRNEEGTLQYHPDMAHRSPYKGDGFKVGESGAILMRTLIAPLVAANLDNEPLVELAEFIKRCKGFSVLHGEDDDEDEILKPT